ncbi:MAG: hypothetical protein ABI999_04120 [Acidobacteriota bacterium]
MSNPEHRFEGVPQFVRRYIDLDQINLERSVSFLVDEDGKEIVSTDEPAAPAVHELNCFGIDPNEF